MTLPASLKSRFYIDGFYTPIKIFNNAEISKIYTDYQKFVKKFGKDGSVEGDYRFRVHLLAKWAHDIVTHPTLVSAVKTVLDTQNILCWSTDICRKPPKSRGHIAWHQDSAYSGLEPSDRVVTAWVALTPSNEDTGAVVMWPGSHAETLRHEAGAEDPDNQLVLKQAIPESELAALEGEAQAAVLVPGEASLHSWSPNTSDQERVGLAIRYMSSDVQNIKAVVRERASLICGSGGQWWDLETVPNKDYGEKELEAHRESVAREKKNYLQGQEEATEYK